MKAGWKTQPLGEICEIIKGKKPKLKAVCGKNDLPYLVAKVLRGSAEAEYADVNDRNAIAVDENETIIICDGSNSGEVFYGHKGILSSTMGKISKKIEINDSYLRLFLNSTFDIFNGSKTGAAIPHLDKEALYNLKFSYPPLPEQKKIAAVLDDAFEMIAAAAANAEKNLASARELFETYLNSIFSKEGEDWKSFSLEKLTTKIGSGATPKGGDASYKEQGTPLIRSLNVHDRNFTFRKLAYLDDEQAKKLSNVIVQAGDVLFNITGASIARCCIVPDEVLPARVNQHVSILRPKDDIILPDFLCYLLTSAPYKKILLGIGDGGATRQAITKKQLQELTVTIPTDTKVQEELIDKLDDFHLEIDRLEEIYQQKISALNELKKSLLQKAFSGELTAEMARQEAAA